MVAPSGFESLELRLRTVETSIRRVRILIVVGVALVLPTALCAFVALLFWFRTSWQLEAEKGTIRAESIRLYNESGDADFMMCDGRGMPRMWLNVNQLGEPSIAFYGNGAKRRMGLASRAEGTFLSLYDPQERRRVQICVDQEGPLLKIFDEEGKTVFSAPFGLDLRERE